MPTFRPSLVANFTLKFDESLTLLQPPTPDSVSSLTQAPPQGSGVPTTQPLLLQAGDQNHSYILGRIPKKASVELPGYRMAGHFSLEIDFKDMPIDPRTVRACAVDIHIGTVTDQDASDGFRGQKENGTLKSVLRTRDANDHAVKDTLVLCGIVDDWTVTHNASGSVVSMKGRDLRGILLDIPISAGIKGLGEQFVDKLDLTQDIDDVVRDVLKFAEGMFVEINVVVNPAEWPDGEVKSPSPDVIPRHRLGAKGKRKSGRSTPAGKLDNISFWDLITKLCYLAGAIPFFRGKELVIRPSSTIYDQIRGDFDPVRYPTPFKDGKQRIRDVITRTPITPGLRARRFVYGRDVSSFEFTRKFTGFHRPKVVRVVGTSTESASSTSETGVVVNPHVEGVWPKEFGGAQPLVTGVTPGGKGAQQDVLKIPSAYSDPVHLQMIAKSIFEEIGRGEVGGSIETTNLASFGGDNNDADVLRLRPGDGVEFLVDTRSLGSGSPLISTLTDFERVSYEKAVEGIVARIGDKALARVIVATARGMIAELQRFFRVQTVKYAWSEHGIKVAFDFQNYIVVRDQTSSAPTATGQATRQSVP